MVEKGKPWTTIPTTVPWLERLLNRKTPSEPRALGYEIGCEVQPRGGPAEVGAVFHSRRLTVGGSVEETHFAIENKEYSRTR